MSYFNFFDPQRQWMFLVSLALLIISASFFYSGKTKISLFFLFAFTFLLSLTIALLDNFLFLWDEQFHALVSKNLGRHFLEPTLYDNPVLNYNYQNWTENHIWLHKQPFFLWQTALSLKMFGISELSVRLPSVIMHSILTVILYRMVILISGKNVAYLTAVLCASSYFLLELSAGLYNTDHNDVAFLFYVTLSFWSWFEYKNSGSLKWIILIGLFAGIAVLTKWMVGLLVFFGWGITLLPDLKNKKEWVNLFKSLLICVFVALPWQIFIFYRYPMESSYEFQLAARHFNEIIEGHGETWYFHFTNINLLYGAGTIITILLPLSVIYLFFSVKNKVHLIFIFSVIVVVYFFYTLAQTKMPAFPFVVAALVFYSLASFIWFLFAFVLRLVAKRAVQIVLQTAFIVAVGYLYVDLSRIADYHTWFRPQERNNKFMEMIEKKIIVRINECLPEDNWIVFNTTVTPHGDIPFMFYSDKIAYKRIPSPEEIEYVKDKGYKVLVLNIEGLPDEIKKRKDILIFDLPLDSSRWK
jgi:hypothetical protein